MKSLIGRPNSTIAGDRPVSRSGVLRYCSIARWKASVLSDPLPSVLSTSMRFTVFTPTSALVLA